MKYGKILENPDQPPKFALADKVEYSDMSPWEEVKILQIIEVFPYFEHVYKIEFKDGHTQHTTQEALRFKNPDREEKWQRGQSE